MKKLALFIFVFSVSMAHAAEYQIGPITIVPPAGYHIESNRKEKILGGIFNKERKPIAHFNVQIASLKSKSEEQILKLLDLSHLEKKSFITFEKAESLSSKGYAVNSLSGEANEPLAYAHVATFRGKVYGVYVAVIDSRDKKQAEEDFLNLYRQIDALEF